MSMNRRERRAAKAGRSATAPPPQIQAMLGRGIEHHQAGRLSQAEAAYRDVLEIQPANPDALNLLGVIAHQSGDHKRAVELIGRALKQNAGVALYHNNIGTALRALGRNAEAAKHYRRAIEIEPAYAEAHSNLGNTLMDLGKPEEAVRSYERAIELAPGAADPRTGLGGAYMALDQAELAAPQFRKAVELDPGSALAHRNLANLLEREGDRAAAREHLRRATALDPTDGEAWYELGWALRENYELEEAAACLQRAASLDPDDGAARYSLGLTLKELGYPERAVEQMQAALDIDNDDPEARNSLANLYKELGQLDDAAEQYEIGLRCNPDHEVLLTNRSLLRLMRGNLQAGWADYLARGSVAEKRASLRRDRLGEDLRGQRYLLLRDQGLGDEIFFLRFVRELKERGAWIAYRTDPKIEGIVSRLPFLDETLGPDEEPSAHDAVLSPGDLPHLLGLDTVEKIPPTIELTPLAARVDGMREALRAAGPPPYIGVTWRAGIQLRNKLSKITSLEAVAAALAGCAGTLVALQRAPFDGEIDALTDRAGRPAHDMTALNEDLESMLALLTLLDDYVCVSNTNTHLRAGVGRTSRVLVPFPPDYRWMLEGHESPWFPGTRTYRQSPDGGWDDAFRDLARDLETSFPRTQ